MKVMKFNEYQKLFEFISINEDFEYCILDPNGAECLVSKEDFLEAGKDSAMDPSKINIDIVNKKIIADFND
jgi:hypothetical protein